METKLYEELRDLMVEEATVYAYLKTQQSNGASDLHTAVMIIRQLAKEKKAYFDQALLLTETNIYPSMVVNGPVKMWYQKPKWYQWRLRRKYRRILRTK